MQPLLFELPRPKTDWLAPTVLPDLSGHRDLWVDTESDGLNPRESKAIGISICNALGWKCYLPKGHQGGGNMGQDVWGWANSYQGLRGKHLTFLNAKHDNAMLRNVGVDLEALGCHLHDVSFKAALLDDSRGFGGLDLESLSVEHLGLQKEQLGQAVDKSRLVETHASEVGGYAEQDASLVWQLDQVFTPRVQAEDLTRVLALEDSLIYCVAEMERHGLRLDQEKVARWDEELRLKFGDLILEIWRLTGLRVNPNSGPDLSRLFKHLGLTALEHTASGKESFPAAMLEKLHHQVTDLVIKARRVDSLRSKYFSKFKRAGSHLYYSLHQLKGNEYGTISGRFSGTNGSQQLLKVARQLENFGPDHLVRECVIPDDGFTMLAADAKQIEPRLFVHYAQVLDSPAARKLLKAYEVNPDLDFYTLVQGMIEKIPTLAAMDKKTKRMYTKVGTLGKFYGLSSAESAAEQLKCSEDEAYEFMREYDESFPIVRGLMNKCIELAERRGYIKTVLGRRARLKDKKKAYVMMNRLMQGSAADANKVKLKHVYDNKKLLGVHKLRLTLHDENVADIHPDPGLKATWQELLDEQSLPELKVPILWDVNTGKNWKECA